MTIGKNTNIHLGNLLEHLNYEKRVKLDNDEIMTVLEAINLSVYAYGDFKGYSTQQKKFYLDKMISLVHRFKKAKDLGILTKEGIKFTEKLLNESSSKILLESLYKEE